MCYVYRGQKIQGKFSESPNRSGGYKYTYQNVFYREVSDERARARAREYSSENIKCRNKGRTNPYIYGFPCGTKPWCNSKLKVEVLKKLQADIPRPFLQTDKAEQDLVGNEGGGTSEDSRQDKVNTVRAIASEKQCDKWGFPNRARKMQWCTDGLKVSAQRISNINQQRKLVHKTQTRGFSDSPQVAGGKINTVTYLGIAYDEPTRIERHSKDKNKVLPLVDIGWDEAYCRKWCEENKLLSPIYTTSARGGCWFCHNQGVDQLRQLRKNYPDLWALLLKWDSDSPVTFHADGHTVHDFDKRFAWEDEGYKPCGKSFRWSEVDEGQMNIEMFLKNREEYLKGAD